MEQSVVEVPLPLLRECKTKLQKMKNRGYAVRDELKLREYIVKRRILPNKVTTVFDYLCSLESFRPVPMLAYDLHFISLYEFQCYSMIRKDPRFLRFPDYGTSVFLTTEDYDMFLFIMEAGNDN